MVVVVELEDPMCACLLIFFFQFLANSSWDMLIITAPNLFLKNLPTFIINANSNNITKKLEL